MLFSARSIVLLLQVIAMHDCSSDELLQNNDKIRVSAWVVVSDLAWFASLISADLAFFRLQTYIH
jgi:hypothetical protein